MDSPPPDLLSWAFWFKDSASVRDLLVSFVAIIGIPFLIWREFSTHRTAKAAFNQSQSSAEQVKIAARQAEIAALRHEKQTQGDQDRRITDNFAKAVELLGSDKLEARLGAIYALERIARESKDDHGAIMETLTAYLLTRLPIQQKSEVFKVYADPSSENSQNETVTVKVKKFIDFPADMRAVLTVLNRRVREHDIEGQFIDLRTMNLSWVNLEGIVLKDFDLHGVNLTGANLGGADLTGSNLTMANLSGADLLLTNLTGTDLLWTDLSETDLASATLTGADLKGANLYKATLGMIETNVRNLEKAKFCQTIMPDGSVNNRDCPPEPAPPPPSQTPPAPN